MKRIEQKTIPSGIAGVHLWLLLWKASKSVETQARRSVESTGMCLSDFGILEALLHKGPLPVNVLGSKILLSSGSMTAAIDRLAREGLVERTASAEDRRTRIVRLTSQGSSLIKKLFREHERDLEVTFACFSDRERKTFANLLRKVGQSLPQPT